MDYKEIKKRQDQYKKLKETTSSEILNLRTLFFEKKIVEEKFFEELNKLFDIHLNIINKYNFIYFVNFHKLISKCKKPKKQENYHIFNQKITVIEKKFLKKNQDFMLIHEKNWFQKWNFWNKTFLLNHDENLKNLEQLAKLIFNDKKLLNNALSFLEKLADFFLIKKNIIEKKIVLDEVIMSIIFPKFCATGLLEIIYSRKDFDDNERMESDSQIWIFFNSLAIKSCIKNLLSFEKQQVFEIFEKSASFKNINIEILKTAIYSYWNQNYSAADVLFSVIIENLIRNTVQENNGIVIEPKNKEKFFGYKYLGINDLLKEKNAFFDRFGSNLGELVIFHMKVILVSKFSQNWRNKTLHAISANENEESIKSHWLFQTICVFLLPKKDDPKTTKSI